MEEGGDHAQISCVVSLQAMIRCLEGEVTLRRNRSLDASRLGGINTLLSVCSWGPGALAQPVQLVLSEDLDSGIPTANWFNGTPPYSVRSSTTSTPCMSQVFNVASSTSYSFDASGFPDLMFFTVSDWTVTETPTITIATPQAGSALQQAGVPVAGSHRRSCSPGASSQSILGGRRP